MTLVTIEWDEGQTHVSAYSQEDADKQAKWLDYYLEPIEVPDELFARFQAAERAYGEAIQALRPYGTSRRIWPAHPEWTS